MGQEAAQLALRQWAAVIGVAVAGQHVDAHGVDLADVYRSAADGSGLAAAESPSGNCVKVTT